MKINMYNIENFSAAKLRRAHCFLEDKLKRINNLHTDDDCFSDEMHEEAEAVGELLDAVEDLMDESNE